MDPSLPIPHPHLSPPPPPPLSLFCSMQQLPLLAPSLIYLDLADIVHVGDVQAFPTYFCHLSEVTMCV